MRCTYCGSKFHTITNCPKTFGGSISRIHMRCTYCGERTHNIEACPKTYSGSSARKWNPESVADNFVLDK